MNIHIKATGYYNSTNNRVCLLREGDILEAKSYDHSNDSWESENLDGKTVWVEKENCTVIQ